MMVGCPHWVDPAGNRLSSANKASIHSSHDLLLLAEGPVGAVREATVSATVSEMDEGGNTGGRTVLLGQVTLRLTREHTTSLSPAQRPYGAMEHLKTCAKEISLEPTVMTTELDLSHSHTGIESFADRRRGSKRVHTDTNTHVCRTKLEFCRKE